MEGNEECLYLGHVLLSCNSSPSDILGVYIRKKIIIRSPSVSRQNLSISIASSGNGMHRPLIGEMEGGREKRSMHGNYFEGNKSIKLFLHLSLNNSAQTCSLATLGRKDFEIHIE